MSRKRARLHANEQSPAKGDARESTDPSERGARRDGEPTVNLRWAIPRWDSWAIDLLLLLLVWGLFAPDRGLWQDDVAVLSAMSSVGAEPGVTMFNPITTPTRRLLGPLFLFAWKTGHPVLALHMLWGLFWLAIGLVARRVARYLVPDNELAAYLAGALALCATSDFLVDSPVALGYLQAILTLLGTLAFGLAWRRNGNVWHLVASTFLLVISLWTVDVGLTALPILPFLILIAPPAGPGQKPKGAVVPLVASWVAATVPYVLTLIPAMADPTSYFHRATVEITLLARVKQTVKLWLVNFTPWEWPFDRAAFFSRSPIRQPFPIEVMVALAMLGTAVFVWGMRKRFPRASPDSVFSPRNAVIAATLVALSLATNAMFAGVQLWELHYRTHLLSGVWISILVAFLVGIEARRRPWTLLAPIVFVGFGIMGGLERQGYYSGTWQEHQRELLSIVTAAPALKPGTQLVLYVPVHQRYLATEDNYAQPWLYLLYRDLPLTSATYWAPARATGCRAEPGFLNCWRPGQEPCIIDGSCEGTKIPYDRLLVLGYDVKSRTYRIMSPLPTDPPVTPPGYRPEDRIIRRPLTTLQRRLLMLGHRSPARWLPAAAPPEE